MNAERTFGIELETCCKVSRQELADRLTAALRAAGFNHRAVATGYSHNTNSDNATVWHVKSDGSIRPHASPRTLTYVNDAEIVSPVLKGEEGLRALQVVCDYIHSNDLCRVNVSCGMHVHHGVRREEVVPALVAYKKVERTIYEALPNSRQDNSYCRKVALAIPRDATYEQVEYLWQRRRIGRRRGFNLESYWLRGTIEFRCAAGTVEYDKAANWILVTQLLIDRAVAGATFKAGIDNLCKTLNGEGREVVRRTHKRGASARNTELLEFALSVGVTGKPALMEALRKARPDMAERMYYEQVTRFLGFKGTVVRETSEHPALTWFRARHEYFTTRRAA